MTTDKTIIWRIFILFLAIKAIFSARFLTEVVTFVFPIIGASLAATISIWTGCSVSTIFSNCGIKSKIAVSEIRAFVL